MLRTLFYSMFIVLCYAAVSVTHRARYIYACRVSCATRRILDAQPIKTATPKKANLERWRPNYCSEVMAVIWLPACFRRQAVQVWRDSADIQDSQRRRRIWNIRWFHGSIQNIRPRRARFHQCCWTSTRSYVTWFVHSTFSFLAVFSLFRIPIRFGSKNKYAVRSRNYINSTNDSNICGIGQNSVFYFK